MTCMLEVTLASIQASTRGTVLRVMLARRVVSLSKAVAHSSSIYASQRQKQQISHLWFNWQGSTSKRFSKMAQQFVDEKVKNNKVMVFSKSYCPFCKMAKEALGETGVKYGLVELDERDDGSAIQDYLLKITGARSVPRVFIDGKCIGGGSETRALQDQGKLVPMLKEIGAL